MDQQNQQWNPQAAPQPQQYQQPAYQQPAAQPQYQPQQQYQQPAAQAQYQYQQQYQQPAYQQPAAQPQYQQVNNYYGSSAPAIQLATNRSLVKFFFLSLVTFGIYGIVVMSKISSDINLIASKYDGRRTMHYCLLYFLLGPVTLGILTIIWFHKLSGRIGNELVRRNIAYNFNAGQYWLWNVLGSLFFAGPFIYTHKLCTAMNLLSRDYNLKG